MTRWISWAENHLDVVLLRAFPRPGSYLDVGAGAGDHGSISRALFDHGWSGAHVAASDDAAAFLQQRRPGDVVVGLDALDDPASLVALLPAAVDVVRCARPGAAAALAPLLRPACVVDRVGEGWPAEGYRAASRDRRHVVLVRDGDDALAEALSLPPDDEEYEPAAAVAERLRAEAAEGQLAVARATLATATARRVALEARLRALETPS